MAPHSSSQSLCCFGDANSASVSALGTFGFQFHYELHAGFDIRKTNLGCFARRAATFHHWALANWDHTFTQLDQPRQTVHYADVPRVLCTRSFPHIELAATPPFFLLAGQTANGRHVR